MTDSEVKVIRGGWKNVPDNLFCKTDLLKMGLVPKDKNKPVAVVWNSYQWIDLYDISQCRKKRKPSQKQLEALKKGREKTKKMTTCSRCGKNVYFLNRMVDDVCKECFEVIKQQEKIEALIKQREEMMNEGIEKFKSWFYEDFLILDTETTGLNFGDEIIELAIIDKKGNVLFDSFFKPKNMIPDDVIDVHGITNEMVINAPNWKEKWNEIKNLIENKKILIYNADFDVIMINSTNNIWGIQDNYSINCNCVMETYRLYVGSERSVKLSEASGIPTSHRAVDDCLSVLKLINDVWNEIGLIKNEDELRVKF